MSAKHPTRAEQAANVVRIMERIEAVKAGRVVTFQEAMAKEAKR